MFTRVDNAIIWPQITQLRTEFYEYLQTLTSADWDTPSLCQGWQVRDVVAHLILEYHYTPRSAWRDFLLSGANINKFMLHTAVKLGRHPPHELLRLFSSLIDEYHLPRGVPPLNAVVDLLVHEQDIRIPLNQPAKMPSVPLQLVFAHWQPEKYNLGEKLTGISYRIKGLQFQATDLGIVKGDGAAIKGSAQDILMAASGRKIGLRGLTGPGTDILKERLE